MTISVRESETRDASSKLRHEVSRRGPAWVWHEQPRPDILAFAEHVDTGWRVGFMVDVDGDNPAVTWVARHPKLPPAKMKNFYSHTKALDWAENPVDSGANGVTE